MSVKDEILKQLKKDGGFVSGQELSDVLGVSRTAVWKAVSRLREEGYPIEAVQNRGYCLNEDKAREDDLLNQAELEQRLEKATRWAGHPVFYREEVGSTNDDIMAMADQGAKEGTLVVSVRQTKGKGRRGRTWVSPNEGNVYMSLLLRPKMPTDIAPMVTIVMALAICEACNEICGTDPDFGGKKENAAPFGAAPDGSRSGSEISFGLQADGNTAAHTGTGTEIGAKTGAETGSETVTDINEVRFGIKWPNDIVAQSTHDPAWKKMTGILTEMRLEEREIKDVTIGDGLNINICEFPEEIAATATSVKLETGRSINRADVVAQCLKNFERDYELFVKAGSLAPLKEAYEKLLVNRERPVRVLDPQQPFTGVAVGISDRGGLLVIPDEGEFPETIKKDGTKKADRSVREVTAGEVSVRGVEGYV